MGRYPRTIEHGYFRLMAETTLDGEHWVRKRGGYRRPHVVVGHQRWLASRVVLHIHAGLDLDDPEQLACHRCSNPRCYNPAHLYIGSKSDNATDGVRMDEV